jgi:hypothetical protein
MYTLGAPHSTSYFSAPEKTLDPQLFDGRTLKGWVRNGIHEILFDFLKHEYRHAELWAHPWLAGSGVSYQWSASRHPGDLDCLIGLDYVQFRKANPEYAYMGDNDVSQMMNELFKSALQPKTEDWHGYELTFYVNPGATDIRTINPYAAYDLKYDEWTVPPDPTQEAPTHHTEWDTVAGNDAKMAQTIYTRYTQALDDLKLARDPATRRNAEVRKDAAASQGVAMWDEIHHNRRLAFTMEGAGYYDFNNYRWQAAKRSGAHEILRGIKNDVTAEQEAEQPSVYGTDLPDANTLIRRAATYRLGE